MNILYVVFVNEKPVWKKKFQENSLKNTSVEKKWIIWRDFTPFKSSHRSGSVKKDVKKFHRKTPMLESAFNKIAGVQAYNFIKRRLQHRCFAVKIPKFLRTPILKNIWKKEHLPTAASCLTEAKYAYAIKCYTGWNQLYISTMVLSALPEVFFSSF